MLNQASLTWLAQSNAHTYMQKQCKEKTKCVHTAWNHVALRGVKKYYKTVNSGKLWHTGYEGIDQEDPTKEADHKI